MPAIAHQNKILGDDIQSIHWSQAKTSVKKNLLPNNAVSQTIHGVTFTVNSDGSISISGTASADSGVTFYTTKIKAGTYIFSRGEANIPRPSLYLTTTSYSMIVELEGGNATVNEKEFTLNSDTEVIVSSWITSGTVYSTTFYPMIRLASIADDTYEPYIPDNTELMRYTDNAVLGAKNRLPNEAISQTVNGVTFTKNADGTITANGTATADIFYVIHYDSSYSDVILSGCPANGSLNTYRIQYSNFVDQSFSDDGNGVYIPTTKNAGNWRVVIFIGNGQTVNNLVFKPMIRLATDTDDTYVPYAMTNRELTYPKTASATINTTNANSGNITIIRLGSLRIATGYFNPKVAGTSATNVTIATVPIQDIGDAFALCGRNQGDSVDTLIGGLVRINTAGELKYQGHVTGANLFFNLVYTAR